MKRLFAFICLLFLVAAVGFAQSGEFVRVEGKYFVEPNGNKILLRGINLGNWLNPEGYMFKFQNVNSFRLIDNTIKELVGADETRKFWKSFRDNYITKEDIRFIKESGLNHIRLPFNFKLFLVEDHPEIWLEEGFRRLDDAVKWCKEENLYVILDLHAAPGGQTGDNIDDSWSYPWLFEDEQAQKTTIALWKKLAERYKDETIVIGYDLLNEPIPHYMENKEELNLLLEPVYKMISAAIREVDKNHIILLGGAQWNTNFKMFGAPYENNLAYTFHRYWMPPEQKEIQDVIDFVSKYNVPMYMGESGENEDAWIDTFRKLLEKHEFGWCFWPYKKMDSPRGMVQFAKTKEWDEIIKYAETPKKNFEEMRKAKPPREVVKKALSDLLENIKFKNCTANQGYLKALGL
ncbi:MAG: glycoside hydrolase family protein [Ignavibacteria bacterium]|nr:MAG: glycoside hydrolase family protein [Ignavibacteria bacterium]KAF0156681.1 MAG: glycoside hydrolase family protein [Ignavibacteria bacterium]